MYSFERRITCKLTNETLSFLTADVYCNSLISDRDDVCDTKYGDFTAIFLTPSYHSAGHRPNKELWKLFTINTVNASVICYKQTLFS